MTTDDVTPPLPPIAPQQTAAQPAAPSRFWRFVKALVMPWPVSGRWAWRKVRKCPVWAIAVTTVIVAVAFIYRQPIWDFVSEAKDGKIIVNSPTVYTRQRLVNDRLDQARWLRTQLDTTEVGKDSLFKEIDQVRRITSEVQAGAGGATVKPAQTTTDISVEATTTALFRAKNAYREEVRAELTQTELDDRHDIQGNTIFRLTFDASVVAGTRKDSVAVVSVNLNHSPIEIKNGTSKNEPIFRIKQGYESDYRGLYQDWLRFVQTAIGKSLETIPYSFLSSNLDQQVRLPFSDFLFRRLCQFLENDSNLTKAPRKCADQVRPYVEALFDDFSRNRIEFLKDDLDNQFYTVLNGYKMAGYQFPQTAPQSESPAASQPREQSARPDGNLSSPSPSDPFAEFRGMRDAAVSICANYATVALWQLNIKLPRTSGSGPPVKETEKKDAQNSSEPPASATDRTKSEASKPSAENVLASNDPAKPEPAAKEIVPCPYYESLARRLVSGVLMYERLYSLAKANQFPAIEGSVQANTDIRKTGLFETLQSLVQIRKNNKDEWQIEPEQKFRFQCFSSDFTRSNLNSFQDQGTQDYQKIEHFLVLELTGRELNDCNLVVRSGSKNFKFDRPSYNAPILEFTKNLNTNTDAFAYSVTPKNLTENISTASESRDAFAALISAAKQGGEIASFLQNRSEQYRSIIANPIVVGFGFGYPGRAASSSDPTSNPYSKQINLGWIIAGRTRQNGKLEQIDGQYPLTAFISVPGWWRAVEAKVTTCWISRTSLSNLQPDNQNDNICDENAKSTSIVTSTIRLPSSIPEISRKLGLDVIQQPSLYRTPDQELTVGRKGLLLLEGARLWRSTEVTAGPQRASKITVLPNMEGILAEFTCVLPPSGQRFTRPNKDIPTDPQEVSEGQGRVWTSEGVTTPFRVYFTWPKYWDSELKKCLEDASPATETTAKKDGAPIKRDTASTVKKDGATEAQNTN